MPRASKVTYWPTRGGYGTWIKGEQIILAKGPKDEPHGPTYRKALKQFADKMELAAVGKPGAALSIKAILEVYFRDHGADLAANTLGIRQMAANQFVERFPGLLASELTSEQLKAFIREGRLRGTGTAKSKPWSETTAAMKYGALRVMLRWALDEGYLTTDPFARKSRLKFHTRARDRIVTPAEHDRIMEHFNRKTQHWFTGVVMALENTGARLSEILRARVRDWNDDMGALVYYSDRSRRSDDFRHKSAATKDRIIFFTGKAIELVRFLVKDKAPDAPVFQNRKGGRFSLQSAVLYFTNAREATGLRHVTAHAYRHTFATRWLQRDGNIDALAACLGDNPETIRRTYSHLLTDTAGLRAKLEAVMHPCTEIRP